MLEARLKSYHQVHAKLVKRNDDLLSMEGWYKVTSEQSDYLRYLRSESKLSFSRWLLKTERLREVEISKIVKQVTSENTSIKISCRFNDLLRAADSPHFNSCLAPNKMGSSTTIYLLKDPTIAIAYTPDNGGFFLGRAIFSLKNNHIQIFRCYGTFTHSMLTRFFMKNFAYAVHSFPDDVVSYFLFGED
jgi:hypothetical protein